MLHRNPILRPGGGSCMLNTPRTIKSAMGCILQLPDQDPSALTPTQSLHSRLSLQNIETASRSIDPVFLNSPQFESQALSELLGLKLVLKVETVNPIRSFKGRGADFLSRNFPPTRRGWFA